MFQSEFDQFKALMSDLCTAFNRPYTDDVVRVFWEALKGYPLAQMRVRMKVAAGTLKKFPTPLDLTPEPEPPRHDPGEQSIFDQLADFALRTKPLTPRQWRGWTFIYRGNSGGPGIKPSADFAVTGLIIPPDGDAPGYRIMVEDMQLEYAA